MCGFVWLFGDCWLFHLLFLAVHCPIISQIIQLCEVLSRCTVHDARCTMHGARCTVHDANRKLVSPDTHKHTDPVNSRSRMHHCHQVSILNHTTLLHNLIVAMYILLCVLYSSQIRPFSNTLESMQYKYHNTYLGNPLEVHISLPAPPVHRNRNSLPHIEECKV